MGTGTGTTVATAGVREFGIGKETETEIARVVTRLSVRRCLSWSSASVPRMDKPKAVDQRRTPLPKLTTRMTLPVTWYHTVILGLVHVWPRGLRMTGQVRAKQGKYRES